MPSETGANTSSQRDIAQDYYEKARQISKEIEFSPENKDELLRVASYLRLAIEHSQGRHVEACAMLSFIMLALDERSKAKQYAEMAVAQQPHNFTARASLFFLSCLDLEGYRPYIDHSSTAGTVLTIGWALAKKSSKKAKVMATLRDLLLAFHHNVHSAEKKDIEEWVNMAEMLLTVGNALSEYGLADPEIYREILTVPWDQVQHGEVAEKVVDIRTRAEGLYLLGKR